MLRTRSFTLESVKAAQPAADGVPAKAKVYKFRASDGEFDRYQDRLNVKGWKLDAFNANPVVLFNHDDGYGYASRGLLPIGKARMFFEGDLLMSEVEFDQDDPFAKQIESKVEKGILSAVSVRYRMLKYHENDHGGFDCDEQELLELSIVTIPGNQRAVRAKGLEDSPVSPGAITMTPEQIKAMQAENERLKALEAARIAAEEAAKRQKEIDDAVEKAVTAKIMEQAKGNRDGFASALQTEGVRVGKRAVEGTGIELARFMKAKAVAALDGTPGHAATLAVLKRWGYEDQVKSLGSFEQTKSVLSRWGYEERAKALSSADFSGLGSLIRPEYADEFIELLRNQTVVRKAGATQIPMGASLTFDGQTGAASAAYVGETTNITKSNPTSGQPLKLTEKKLAGLVPVPNDLLRNASPRAEQIVRDDLVRVMALKEDEQFLAGVGSAFSPLGIINSLHSSHTYGMTALGSAGKPTVEEMKRELDKAIKMLKLANMPMEKVVFITSPSPEFAILTAVGPGGEGSNALEIELSNKGTLRRKPAFITNQIAESATTKLLCFDMAQVIIGDSLNMDLEFFPNGAFHDGSTVVSGVSSDQSVFRAIAKHDIGCRYTKCGVVVTGVTWGI